MPDTDSRTTGLDASVADLSWLVVWACDTINRLQSQRAALLAALKYALDPAHGFACPASTEAVLLAAITKAESRS